MKRSVILLLPALVMLASCGTTAQFQSQRFQDGFYQRPSDEAPVELYTEDDFKQMAAENIAAEKREQRKDTIVVTYKDVYPWDWEYQMYFSPFPLYGLFTTDVFYFNQWYRNRWYSGAWRDPLWGPYIWRNYVDPFWYDPFFFDPFFDPFMCGSLWDPFWGSYYGYNSWYYGHYYGGYYPGYYHGHDWGPSVGGRPVSYGPSVNTRGFVGNGTRGSYGSGSNIRRSSTATGRTSTIGRTGYNTSGIRRSGGVVSESTGRNYTRGYNRSNSGSSSSGTSSTPTRSVQQSRSTTSTPSVSRSSTTSSSTSFGGGGGGGFSSGSSAGSSSHSGGGGSHSGGRR